MASGWRREFSVPASSCQRTIQEGLYFLESYLHLQMQRLGTCEEWRRKQGVGSTVPVLRYCGGPDPLE